MIELAPWLQACHKQVQHLKQSKKLSHALLITGADGVGQEYLAKELVKDLMCEKIDQGVACGHCHSCELMAGESHPDYYFLDGEEATIKVDQVRQLINKINQKPQVGNNKVVLITHAQSMNINASNAVLKALEEPADQTYFLLTSSQSTSLMPTIRSRCLLVNVPTPSQMEVESWLQSQPDGEALSALFWLTTQPFRLLSLEKQQKTGIYTSLPEKIKELMQGTTTVESLLTGVSNSNTIDYCNGLAAILHQCLCHSAGRTIHPVLSEVYPLIMQRMGIQALMTRYQALQRLKSDLSKTNLNPVMQLTHELNQW
ncbi:DNA polymerase III subunit delta' [Marinomonas spartinae]|uniref:DNA-directed DNA polymerase n=1 Tax=Marinomonas spartinae TaxID=1792290 RepID=A0A1A8TL97_9GAMM|nr:DNA polymerase III subunit delta' [Marinomonas spartinae]SBS33818.1 DNA polymerase III subunit delta' [Marinomonas spartinae]